MITRRQVVSLLAVAAGVIWGKPLGQPGRTGPGIVLPLDETGPITVRYRGMVVTLTPEEIMAALTTRGKDTRP